MDGPKPLTALVRRTLVVRNPDGTTSVQTLGPEHVMDGSEMVVEVPDGCVVVVLHVPRKGRNDA